MKEHKNRINSEMGLLHYQGEIIKTTKKKIIILKYNTIIFLDFGFQPAQNYISMSMKSAKLFCSNLLSSDSSVSFLNFTGGS